MQHSSFIVISNLSERSWRRTRISVIDVIRNEIKQMKGSVCSMYINISLLFSERLKWQKLLLIHQSWVEKHLTSVLDLIEIIKIMFEKTIKFKTVRGYFGFTNNNQCLVRHDKVSFQVSFVKFSIAFCGTVIIPMWLRRTRIQHQIVYTLIKLIKKIINQYFVLYYLCIDVLRLWQLQSKFRHDR